MSKTIKVLFVIDGLDVGGAQKSILDIASKFQTVVPVVCALYSDNILKGEFEREGIKVICLNIRGRYQFLRASNLLQRVIACELPDLIHSSLFRSDIVCRITKFRRRFFLINSLVNNSYSAWRYKNSTFLVKIKLGFFESLDFLTIRLVDLFVSNGITIKKANAKALRIDETKIVVIPRGRRIEDFDDRLSDQNLFDRGCLAVGKRVILNVGRLLDRKGQLDLLRAFHVVRQRIPDVRLVIAGEGPFRSRLEKEITRLNLENEVCLLGNRDDIPQLLKRADVFVFASYYEGLPGALIEAMMSGVPIIASAIPENLECVTTEACLTFPPGDVVELSNKIVYALENPDIVHRMSQRAVEISRERFDVRKIAADYEAMYLALMENRA